MMTKLIISTIIFGWLALAAPSEMAASASGAEAMRVHTASVQELLAQADALYARRAELVRVDEALQSLLQAFEMDPSHYDVNWRLAKYSYYFAAHTSDKTARNSAIRQGIAAGERAVKLQPDKPEGHFWLGANLGERARSQGAFRALGTVGNVRREMETVLKLDPGYQNGSAYMVLAQIDLELPGLVGGDKKRAVQRLEQGLVYGKENAFLRLRLAEAYLAVKNKAEARRQLDVILSMKPDPDYLPEYKEAALQARQLLSTVTSDE